MVGFRCSLAMKKKIISYGTAPIFFDLVRNILRIWYNYCMFILLVIIIGLTFVIVFNFHHFKSFFLCLARRICTIAENSAEKLKNLENLKTDLSKYHYRDSLIKRGFQKALSIPQKDLQKPKKLSNENILPFITTFNPNNPNIYSTIKSSVNCLKNNNVSGFHNIKLIQSKRQSRNLKKLLTKAEFGEILSGTFNCSDKDKRRMLQLSFDK